MCFRVLWKLELARNDAHEQRLLVDIWVVIVEEWIGTIEHFINEDAERPNISRLVMALVQNNLRSLEKVDVESNLRKRASKNQKQTCENMILTMKMGVPQNVKVLSGTYLAVKQKCVRFLCEIHAGVATSRTYRIRDPQLRSIHLCQSTHFLLQMRREAKHDVRINTAEVSLLNHT
jgi:hypothetical protein